MKGFLKAMRTRAVKWFNQNMMLLIAAIDMLMPLVALMVQKQIEGRQGFLLGLVVCFIIQAMISVYRRFYAWQKEKYNIPIPERRFTREEGDGEVTIEYSRLQELILFMDTYENWLEEQGMKPEENQDGNNSN